MKKNIESARMIKSLRVKKGLRQREFCKEIGIGLNSLVKIEKGDYSSLRYPVMIRISKFFNCTVQELFFQDED